MNREFFKIACTRLSLFRPAARTRALVRALSEATGIPLLQLMAAERRIRTLQSFAPLKDLLNDKDLQERYGFRYRIGVEQRRHGALSPFEQLASKMKLSIKTARGRVDIVARVEVAKRILPLFRRQQSARIILCYQVRCSGKKQVYTQALSLSGESVGGKPIKREAPRPIAGIPPRTQHA